MLQPERDLGSTPLFRVLLVLQDAGIEDLPLPGLMVKRESEDTGVAKFDLTLELAVEGGDLHGRLEGAR
jgi:hypothetical protein